MEWPRQQGQRILFLGTDEQLVRQIISKPHPYLKIHLSAPVGADYLKDILRATVHHQLSLHLGSASSQSKVSELEHFGEARIT